MKTLLRIFLLFCVVNSTTVVSLAQNISKADSLIAILPNAPDAEKPAIYNDIAREYLRTDPAKAEKYATDALTSAQGLSDRKEEASALNLLATVKKRQGSTGEALDLFKKSLQIREEIEDKKGIASCLTNIGGIYSDRSDFETAINYMKQAYSIKIEIDDKEGAAIALFNIGKAYYRWTKLEEAIKYNQQALKLFEEIGHKGGVASCYNTAGTMHESFGNLEKALISYQDALKIEEEQNNVPGIADANNNLGNVYCKLKDPEKAEEHYQIVIQIRREIGDKQGEASTLNNLGVMYTNIEKPQKALKYLDEALTISREIESQYEICNNLVGMAKAYIQMGQSGQSKKYLEEALEVARSGQILQIQQEIFNEFSNIAERSGDYKTALENYKLYKTMGDSIVQGEALRQFQELNARYETDKKEKEIQLLSKDKEVNELLIKKKDEEAKRQRVILFAVLGGLVIVLLSTVLLLRLYNQKKKANLILAEQKKEIEMKNLHILDSIRYAMRIQQAILPTRHFINQEFPDSFILYQPKDIVSGDFYWAETIGTKVFFSAVDCTGHGVPGAFMSIVGMHTLNQAINEEKLSDPAAVLNFLSKKINESLRKSGDESEVKDGMDLALCALDREKMQLEFAGVHNPMYIVRGEEVLQFKPEKHPIGEPFDDEFQGYSNTLIDLQKGDTIYLFSDGYPDQFGGPKRKKLLSKRFREILLVIRDMGMNEQQAHLEKTFEEWRGDTEQYDDVTIFAVRM
ncbi:MAG: tetratricopeptide repeat protein [Bacteroidetes bacterium]|nr:tetratricopeptide repeat protein [Bacteroidota bacterium]